MHGYRKHRMNKSTRWDIEQRHEGVSAFHDTHSDNTTPGARDERAVFGCDANTDRSRVLEELPPIPRGQLTHDGFSR